MQRTFADLPTSLGGISPGRIVLDPPPGTATEADMIRLVDSVDKRLCELIDGVLVEKVPGFPESLFTGEIVFPLHAFVRSRNLGVILGADGPFRTASGNVRMPSAAFYSWNRLPGRKIPDVAIAPMAPNIAVEVRRPANTDGEMALKRRDYLASGVEIIWEFRLSPREVRVITPATDITLEPPAHLTCGNVLQGFTLPLADLFAELDRKG